MIKKNLRHLHAVVTKQTYWNLMHWAEAVGLPEREIGRIIDRLVREKTLQGSTSRRFEEAPVMPHGELIQALNRLKVQTGSLACLGCGYEHNCSAKGCRILREAAERLGASNPAHEPLFLNRTGGGTNEE